MEIIMCLLPLVFSVALSNEIMIRDGQQSPCPRKCIVHTLRPPPLFCVCHDRTMTSKYLFIENYSKCLMPTIDLAAATTL